MKRRRWMLDGEMLDWLLLMVALLAILVLQWRVKHLGEAVEQLQEIELRRGPVQ